MSKKVQDAVKAKVERLEYASLLINRDRKEEVSPMDIVIDALRIMEFGGITMRDVLDWAEATGKS